MSKTIGKEQSQNSWYTPWVRKNTRPTINRSSNTNTPKLQQRITTIQSTYQILPKVIPKRRESILYIPEDPGNPEKKKNRSKITSKRETKEKRRERKIKTKEIRIQKTSLSDKNPKNKIEPFQEKISISISPYLKKYKIPKNNPLKQNILKEPREAVLVYKDLIDIRKNNRNCSNTEKSTRITWSYIPNTIAHNKIEYELQSRSLRNRSLLNHNNLKEQKTEVRHFRNLPSTKSYLKMCNGKFRRKKEMIVENKKYQTDRILKILRKYIQ